MDKTKGGVPARLGKKFHEEIEQIKKSRLFNNNSDKLLSTEKITDVIVRHKLWPQISKDMIEEPEETFNK